MKSIPLTQNQYAIVDDEDYDELIKHKWYAQYHTVLESYYAMRRLPRTYDGRPRLFVMMHRQIMGLEYGDERQVDHIDHDTLNNLRWNLRVCTCRENNENRKNQSKHGVGVKKIGSAYQVMVHIDGKNTYLGRYATPEEATNMRAEILESLEV